MTVRARIAKVLEDAVGLNVSEADLAAAATLDDVAPVDSLTLVQFVAGLEQEFEIRFAPSQLQRAFLLDFRQIETFLGQGGGQP